MDPTAGNLTSLLPFWAETSSFFILGVLLLFEKRTHVQNIFVPKTQHIWADINFHLNESQNAVLNNEVPSAPSSSNYWSSSIAAVNHAIATSAQSRDSTEGSKQPNSLSLPKEAELIRALSIFQQGSLGPKSCHIYDWPFRTSIDNIHTTTPHTHTCTVISL